ncbi:rhodanese-like domain-containing protein [Kineosporia sp. R_H_3]|uniref:rhodanese-like domain-containing protein n=1 Tax=Kineosporia sp. R_H_3 TaxID=1961848 RepID=UPI000B4B4572|nr:rhodanese-like domain-containing protein [Kineosporia sp. R_H_3]
MPYAGDLSPTDAYRRVADGDAVLVDVRTAAEWSYVGVPDLSGIGRELVRIEWVSFPDGARNPAFLEQLEAEGVGQDTHVLFLCRSGVRSVAAAEAATAAGWANAYNVTDGFEGPTDAAGHRGTSAGWKAAGLPWRQG